MEVPRLSLSEIDGIRSEPTSPEALPDPTPKCRSGQKPGDLASSIGHEGIARYLAAMDLNKQEKDVAEIHEAKVIPTVSQHCPASVSNGDLSYVLSLKDSLADVCNGAQAAAPTHQLFRKRSFLKKRLKVFGNNTFGNVQDDLSLVGVQNHKPRDHDDLPRAAAMRTKNKFRCWKDRKYFLIFWQQIVEIQAHVRKICKKIVRSLKILDKPILYWRQKGNDLSRLEGVGSKSRSFSWYCEEVNEDSDWSGLEVIKLYALDEDVINLDDDAINLDDDAIDQGQPLNTLGEDIQEWRLEGSDLCGLEGERYYYSDAGDYGARARFGGSWNRLASNWEDSLSENISVLQDVEPIGDLDLESFDYISDDIQKGFPGGVESQPLHPSSSSTQPANAKQGHEMLKELSNNSIGERTEFWSCQPIQGESQVILKDCAEGVGSEPFHPSLPSTQPADSQGNIANQSNEILREVSTNRSFGEQEELGNHLQIQRDSQGTASIQSVDVASERVMDYTNEFNSHKIFKSKEALMQCIHEIGRKNGFVIVIKRSDSGNRSQKARITFGCERGGQYKYTQKNKEDRKEKQLRNISTKKCGCPFTLKGHHSGSDDNWMLKVICGVHNHLITIPLEGRSYVGRLSKEENLLVSDMSKSKVRPKDILVKLKSRDTNNVSTIKHIYNARQRHHVKEKTESSNDVIE